MAYLTEAAAVSEDDDSLTLVAIIAVTYVGHPPGLIQVKGFGRQRSNYPSARRYRLSSDPRIRRSAVPQAATLEGQCANEGGTLFHCGSVWYRSALPDCFGPDGIGRDQGLAEAAGAGGVRSGARQHRLQSK
jgi:hypothetical protein